MEPKKPAKPRHKPGEPYKDNRGARPGKTTHTNRGGNLGQEPFVPTAEQRRLVAEYAAMNMKLYQMVKLITHPDGRPICVDTLKKHFKEEIENGGLRAISEVGSAMFRGALAGNAAMAKLFWNIHAKRLGFDTEKIQHDHSGTVGVMDWGPIIEATPPEARAALLAVIEKQIKQAVENAGNPDEDPDQPE